MIDTQVVEKILPDWHEKKEFFTLIDQWAHVDTFSLKEWEK